jgi:hypothetical protein
MKRVSEEEISRFIKSLSLIGPWLKGRFNELEAAKDGPADNAWQDTFFLWTPTGKDSCGRDVCDSPWETPANQWDAAFAAEDALTKRHSAKWNAGGGGCRLKW